MLRIVPRSIGLLAALLVSLAGPCLRAQTPVVEEPFYNIQARCDEAADARLAKITDNEVRLEKRNAIRALLADRLGLKTHLETRETAIYNLVVAKGGVKMTLVPAPPSPANGEAPPPP